MVRANDENTDNPAATSDINTKEHNSGCLTRMLDWLMKWWIPFGLAGLLLIICTPIAFLWGGQFHWPSANGITVCLTIAGAGLAFSSWQQRIEDNAKEEDHRAQEQRELEAQREERERNRLEQVERDEYWKRREQIYQLLGSENPGLRLGAVALLAELADSAAHSTLLNETEKRQLQRHIIDTLCLQIRHEGLNQNNEGTCEEHAKIQQSIIGIILRRINSISQRQQHANWSNEEIILDQCHIVSAIQIQEVISNARLSLNQTTFHKSLTIKRSQLPNLEWENAIFEQELFTVDSSTIKLTSPPLSIRRALFSNSIIHPSIGRDIEIELPPTVEQIRFEACCFIRQHCYCTSDCSCRSQQNTEQCTCKRCDRCPCTAVCKWATIKIATTNEHATVSTPTTPDLTITGCDVATINTTLTTPRISINITHNRIQEQILTIITSEFITRQCHRV